MGLFRRNGLWGVDLRDARGRRVRRLVGPRKREAQAVLERMRDEVRRGVFHLPPRRCSVSFADYVDRYLDRMRSVRVPATYHAERSCLRAPREFLGLRPLAQISRGDIERYIEWRRSTPGPSGRVAKPRTVNTELDILHHLFAVAERENLIVRNPLDGLPRLAAGPLPERVLSPQEELLLLAVCPPWLRVAVEIALYAGLRLGEVVALDWRHVDFDAGILRVECGKGGRRRDVPMARVLANLLADWRRSTGGVGGVIASGHPGDIREAITRGFPRAVRCAGIPPLRFHDLRHTFATRVARAGADFASLQALLGDRAVRHVMRYVHPSFEGARHAIELFEGGGLPDAQVLPPASDAGRVN